MSVEGSAIFSTATAEPNASRRSASFSPSIWGDHFLSYATDSMVRIIILLVCLIVTTEITVPSNQTMIIPI